MTRNFTKLILKSPYETHYFTEDDLVDDYNGYENICKIWSENNVIKIKHGNDGDFIPTFTYIFIPKDYTEKEFQFKPYQNSISNDCKILKCLTYEYIILILTESPSYKNLIQSKRYHKLNSFQKYLIEIIYDKITKYFEIDDIEDFIEDEFIVEWFTCHFESEMDIIASNLMLDYDNTFTYYKLKGILHMRLLD